MSVNVDAWPWPAGSATGVGSLPGADMIEALKMVFGELAGLPHLPELPARGPGADMIGRAAGLLTELPVELYAGRWRVGRGGRDLRRTRDLLERDLDAITEVGAGHAGPVKLQSGGPWTLAASLQLAVGGPMLRDHGAVGDLTASLADGLRAHVAEVRRRLPAASVLLQLDEPSLPAVLAGRVPTESGLYTLRAVAAGTAEAALRHIVDSVGVPVIVHCCAAGVPFDLLRTAGAAAVSIDVTTMPDDRELDSLGELLDAGLGLFAGAVPTTATAAAKAAAAKTAAAKTAAAKTANATAAGVSTSARVADTVTGLWRRLGFPLSQLPHQVVVTPTCGLAHASADYARAALSTCAQAAQRLAEQDG